MILSYSINQGLNPSWSIRSLPQKAEDLIFFASLIVLKAMQWGKLLLTKPHFKRSLSTEWNSKNLERGEVKVVTNSF